MKNIFIFLIFVILISVAIIGFFLLGIPQTTLYISALAFLLVSLIVSMLSLIKIRKVRSEKDSLYHSIGTLVIVWIYQISVAVITPLALFFNELMTVYILIEIVLIAFYAIGTVIVNAAAHKVHSMNEETARKREAGEFNEAKRGGY
jgi:amino acid transporter